MVRILLVFVIVVVGLEVLSFFVVFVIVVVEIFFKLFWLVRIFLEVLVIESVEVVGGLVIVVVIFMVVVLLFVDIGVLVVVVVIGVIVCFCFIKRMNKNIYGFFNDCINNNVSLIEMMY